jgi:hypothetical protein
VHVRLLVGRMTVARPLGCLREILHRFQGVGTPSVMIRKFTYVVFQLVATNPFNCLCYLKMEPFTPRRRQTADHDLANKLCA